MFRYIKHPSFAFWRGKENQWGDEQGWQPLAIVPLEMEQKQICHLTLPAKQPAATVHCEKRQKTQPLIVYIMIKGMKRKKFPN